MPRLELTIVGCSGLANVEAVGTVDPYCTIQFEGKGYATDACPDTTNPIWNKTFRFNVADAVSSQAHICVWNKNVFKDDFLGDYWLSIGDGLVQGRPDDRKVLLTKCKGNCELHITVTALDFGLQEAVLSGPAATPFNPPPRQEQQFPPTPPQCQHQYPPAPQQQAVHGYPIQQHVVPIGKVAIRNSMYGTNVHGKGGRVCTIRSDTSFETWRVESIEGKYTFCSFDGNYLRADPNFSVDAAPHCQDWEKWTIEGHPTVPGKLLIRSVHGTYLRAERDSSAVSVSTNPSDGDAWEMVSLSGPGKKLDVPAGGAFLRSHHNTHLQGHGGKVCTSRNMDTWEKWVVEPLGDGRYALRPHDGGYLRADPKHFVDIAPHCQDWEKWTIEGHPTVPDRFVIRSHHGTFLRANLGNTSVDLATNPLEWEAWEIVLI